MGIANSAIGKIVGKSIRHVVVKNGISHPKDQVFLLFHDGTAFEFYGEDIHACKGLDKFENPEQVAAYMENHKVVLQFSDNGNSIDFAKMGRDFFKCYFGDKRDVSITEVSGILGTRKIGIWAIKFREMIEMDVLPGVWRKGRLRVTPETLGEWFKLDAKRRYFLQKAKEQEKLTKQFGLLK